MALRLTARLSSAAIALLAFAVLTETRAQDAAPTPSSPQSATTSAPAPAPSGQKGGARAARRHLAIVTCRRRTTPSAARFHHQADARASRPHARLHGDRGLDPPVRRQGRAAGRSRLHLLPARRRRRAHPPGDLPVQWRTRRRLRLSAIRRCRTVAPCLQRRRVEFLRPTRPACPTPKPGWTLPISSSSIRSAPATAASSRPAKTCASGFFRSTATSTRSR